MAKVVIKVVMTWKRRFCYWRLAGPLWRRADELTTGTLHDMAIKARVDRSMMAKTTCQWLDMQTEDLDKAYPECLASSVANSLIARDVWDDCWDRRD